MAGAAGGGGCRAAPAFRVRCLPGRDLEEESVEAGWPWTSSRKVGQSSSAADRRLVATIAAFSSLPANVSPTRCISVHRHADSPRGNADHCLGAEVNEFGP